MADKIILFFILFEIYKLIDHEVRKKRANADKKQREKTAEDRYKAAIETPSVEIHSALKPAKICPSCGASLNGTNDKCSYCGAVIPENVLFKKERALERQRIEHSQYMRELQHREYEKEKAHKRAMELKKEERKSDFIPFFIMLGGALLLFIVSAIFKKYFFIDCYRRLIGRLFLFLAR